MGILKKMSLGPTKGSALKIRLVKKKGFYSYYALFKISNS